MITDKDLATLPGDPEQAFIRLVDLLNDRLARLDGDDWRDAASQYAQAALAFIDETGLEIEVDRRYVYSSFADEGFGEWFERFRNTINYYKNRYLFRHGPVNWQSRSTTVILDDELRSEIHNLLGKMRKAVAQLDISEAKRDAIYAKIAKLAAEVDRSRTRLDAFTDFLLEVGEGFGNAAEKAEPFVKMVERLTTAFSRAKRQTEQMLLNPPASEQPKRLIGPASSQSVKLDDEIPF